jgi:hypothetical protein
MQGGIAVSSPLFVIPHLIELSYNFAINPLNITFGV